MGTDDTDTHFIRSEIYDNDLSGNVFITTSGILNGGNVSGYIRNLGLIAGEVNIGAGSVIRGGTVSAKVTGIESDPVLISSAEITANADLHHVLIGHGTELDPNLRLRPTIRFTPAASIPLDLELTGALPMLSWTSGDGRDVPDLSSDILAPDGGALPVTIIDSIRLQDNYTTFEVRQDSSRGELSIFSKETRATILPYSVRAASPDSEAGLFINEDGDIVLVTSNQREVSAHPVVADNALLQSELDKFGITLHYDEHAIMRLFGADGIPGSMNYLTARADMLAIPASSSAAEGVFLREFPGLPHAFLIYLVFMDEYGHLMQQDLVPMPADWQALKSALAAIAGVSDVRINPQGIISVAVAGQTVRARMAYEVTRSAIGDDTPDEGVNFRPGGDFNGDGMGDLQVLYPSGDSQIMLVLP